MNTWMKTIQFCRWMGIRNYITFHILIGILKMMEFFSLRLRVAVEVTNQPLEPHEVIHGMHTHDGFLCASHPKKEETFTLPDMNPVDPALFVTPRLLVFHHYGYTQSSPDPCDSHCNYSWPWFLAWLPQTCFIITKLPDSLDYWLNQAFTSGLVLLASAGVSGMGPWSCLPWYLPQTTSLRESWCSPCPDTSVEADSALSKFSIYKVTEKMSTGLYLFANTPWFLKCPFWLGCHTINQNQWILRPYCLWAAEGQSSNCHNTISFTCFPHLKHISES